MSNVLSERKNNKLSHWEGSDGLYGASSKPPVCVEKQQALTSRRLGSGYDRPVPGDGERRQNRPTK
jgi:hypothetical protein